MKDQAHAANMTVEVTPASSAQDIRATTPEGITISAAQKARYDKLDALEEKRKASLKRVAAKQTILVWKAKKSNIDATQAEIDAVVANSGRIPSNW